LRISFPITSKRFGDRLSALMELNNINSSLDLAVKLLGYSEKPKSNTQEYSNCKSKEKTIKNHLKLDELSGQNSSRSLASCFLSEYCIFFNCSADYFLGYIDYPTHDYQEIGQKTDLSITAIKMLEIWKQQKSKNSFFTAQLSQSIDALNYLLEYSYNSYQLASQEGHYPGWSIFHHIGSYINADNIVRDMPNKIRFRNGSRYYDMKPGDLYTKSDTGEDIVIEQLYALNEITNDNKKVGLIDVQDPNNRYIADISELYRASALNNITKILFDIKDNPRIEKT